MIYPTINPIALDLGFAQIYWYGLMYLLAFVTAYLLANYRAKQARGWNSQQIEDLIFYGAIGVIVGGRLGYMLFTICQTLLLIHSLFLPFKAEVCRSTADF